MRCISLTQPWTTLVATGKKSVETRSWYTPYRGLLAIHASKSFPGWAKDCCRAPKFELALQEAGYAPPQWKQDRCLEPLPLGVVLCVVKLVSCIRTEQIAAALSEQELAFGDYTPGRWAWKLDLQWELPKPVLARGALGLWDIDDKLVDTFASPFDNTPAPSPVVTVVPRPVFGEEVKR